jgi:hypothetical protein
MSHKMEITLGIKNEGFVAENVMLKSTARDIFSPIKMSAGDKPISPKNLLLLNLKNRGKKNE